MRDLTQPLTEAELQTVASANPYLKSYVGLSKVAASLNDDDQGYALLGLAVAVYGWMPTIFKSPDLSHLRNLQQSLFAQARRCQTVTEGRELVANLPDPIIRNSWVGSSKVLHFINPTVFPIWDSLVALAVGMSRRAEYERSGSYLGYIDRLGTHLDAPCVQQVRDKFRDLGHPYDPSPVRCLELILFTDGRAIRANQLAAKACPGEVSAR